MAKTSKLKKYLITHWEIWKSISNKGRYIFYQIRYK